MSLVAYTVESGDESSGEDSNEAIVTKSIAVKNNSTTTKTSTITNLSNGDEDVNMDAVDFFESDGIDNSNKPLIFAKLPLPKAQQTKSREEKEEEEDDEFLHKTSKIPAAIKDNKVKISIPALNDFKNVNMKYRDTIRDPNAHPLRPAVAAAVADNNKTSKLLGLLPLAKSEQNFMKTNTTNTKIDNNVTLLNADKSFALKKSYFVPDSVRLGRSARNTEDIDEVTVSLHKSALNKTATITNNNNNKRKHPQQANNESLNDNDDNEDASGDFFSLNNNDAIQADLPQVSLNEINAMLAERSAKISTTADAYLHKKQQKQQEQQYTEQSRKTLQQTSLYEAAETNYESVDLDAEALQSLAGRKAAKRAKRDNEQVQIMDIKSNEIMPNRDEWMRTALATSTSYQPTGQLTDEEPQAGTRRKHQITYLAHKAKANEAELQAMWATNRQTRRATQSKYGF